MFRCKCMTSRPAKPLVLIHKRTKQRYPLRGADFVIGRSQGDLVFDHDPKLSGKHCLIRLTPGGFAIHDLKSRTGVHINGTALPAGKACILKPGCEVSIGDQHFTVGEDKPRRSKEPPFVRTAVRIAVWTGLAVGAMASVVNGLNSKPKLTPTGKEGLASLTTIDAEMREAISRLQHFGEQVRTHQMTEEQSLKYLKEELIPRFSSVHTQLQAYKITDPSHATRIDLNRRMAGAYLGQVTAMANYIQTKDIKYSIALGEYNRQMEVINAQVIEESRKPTSGAGAQ